MKALAEELMHAKRIREGAENLLRVQEIKGNVRLYLVLSRNVIEELVVIAYTFSSGVGVRLGKSQDRVPCPQNGKTLVHIFALMYSLSLK
jgi:hypothetical protein